MNKYTVKNRKYHYWRGFVSSLLLVGAFVLVYTLVVPKPDYTMTQAQYDGYIQACNG